MNPAHRRSPETECIRVIDGGRRRSDARAQEARMTAAGQSAARASFLSLPANDVEPFVKGWLTIAREHLTLVKDAPGASSIIAAAAYQPVEDLHKAIAAARAAQLFSREGRE